MNALMPRRGSTRVSFALLLLAPVLMLGLTSVSRGQGEDAFSDDPVKLFEQGQNAHSRGDLAKALEFYEEAIKVRPEFPEAEFQRGSVLVALGRLPQAETAFRRAIELRKDWSMPYSAIGALLVRLNRDSEAETFLRQAVKLDRNNYLALRMLADIRLRSGDAKEALELTRRATEDSEAPGATWFLRALAERATGDNTSALASLNHLLEVEPRNLAALVERAELRIAGGDKEQAIQDLTVAESLIKDDKATASRVAAAYELSGKPAEAHRVAQAAGLIRSADSPAGDANKVIGTSEEIEAANSLDLDVSRKALEALLQKNPKSAMLLARLGGAYRKVDPPRSLDYYRRAIEIEPSNPDYATGYSSALVQARRFADAVAVLRRVVEMAPDNYVAHANLATALYSLKQYSQALTEYEWLLNAKPDLTVTHYFIATAHDFLGEYKQALAAYEIFMARADPAANQLEVERVKLRLPLLRRQVQLGQGVKQKPSQKRKQ
jgi:tetratricopeptide (TPR) repeat protein